MNDINDMAAQMVANKTSDISSANVRVILSLEGDMPDGSKSQYEMFSEQPKLKV